MSWLSELTWSNRDEHLDAMLTGDAELDESVVSTYDRPQGFKFKLAQRLAAGLLPTVGANDKGKTLQTNETTGAPEWAEASGGGGAVYATFTEDNGTWSCDKTYAELKAAYDAGSVIFGVYGGAAGPMAYRTMGNASAFVYGCLTVELSDGAINTLVRTEIAVINDGNIQGNQVTKDLT